MLMFVKSAAEQDDKDLQQAITLSNQVQTGFIAACISGTVYCHNQSAAAAKIAQEEDDEELQQAIALSQGDHQVGLCAVNSFFLTFYIFHSAFSCCSLHIVWCSYAVATG